ncbi:MAG: hypothetical protein ACP5D2_04065 [Candidatus Nanoarchaeia archaeon]
MEIEFIKPYKWQVVIAFFLFAIVFLVYSLILPELTCQGMWIGLQGYCLNEEGLLLGEFFNIILWTGMFIIFYTSSCLLVYLVRKK